MSDQNVNEPEELASEKDDIHSMRGLILWEFKNLEGGTRMDYQQLWRARILLVTMSVGFLGICLTGKFNLEDNFALEVSLIFWVILVFLFYSYDCQVNAILDSRDKKSTFLRNALCKLGNDKKDKDKKYDNLKKKVLRSIGAERDLEFKDTFYNSRLRRFCFKLKSGSKKLDTLLYYSIIVLILIASFASLNNSRRIVEFFTNFISDFCR